MADLSAAGLVPSLGILGWMFAIGGMSLVFSKLRRGTFKELGSHRVIALKWAALTALALFNLSFSLSLLGAALWTALAAATALLSGIVGCMIWKLRAPKRAEAAPPRRAQAKRAAGAGKAKRAGVKRAKRP